MLIGLRLPISSYFVVRLFGVFRQMALYYVLNAKSLQRYYLARLQYRFLSNIILTVGDSCLDAKTPLVHCDTTTSQKIGVALNELLEFTRCHTFPHPVFVILGVGPRGQQCIRGSRPSHCDYVRQRASSMCAKVKVCRSLCFPVKQLPFKFYRKQKQRASLVPYIQIDGISQTFIKFIKKQSCKSGLI